MKKNLLRAVKLQAFLFLSLMLGIVFLYLGVLYGIFGKLPEREELANITNEQASLIYSGDGILIGKVFAQNRTEVDELPIHLKQALISTEDKRFYEHEGYDTRSYFRVLFKSILLGQRSAGGGSTISQQLVKNLFGRPYHGFLSMPINKIREAIVANRIEDVYNKEEILLLYLNSVPFGENTYGIEAAAQRYFNKSTSQLNVEQVALLVGLLKANTTYNPRLNPQSSLSRRNTVLQLMANAEYITPAVSDSLQTLPLGTDYTNYALTNPTGYFVYQVQKEAREILQNLTKENGEAYNIEKDGLNIITTLDYHLQEIALQSVRKQLMSKQKILSKELKNSGLYKQWERSIESGSKDNGDNISRKRAVFSWEDSPKEMTVKDSLWNYYSMLHSSVLAIEPTTGQIKVWIGGNHFRYLPYDLVTSKRQAASAFKPILYATALENGFSPCDYLNNDSVGYENYPDWHPQNYDKKYGGEAALWYALSRSLNLPSVDLYFKLNTEELQLQCQLFGLSISDEEQPSVALGSKEFSLYQMVMAYSAFANYGSIPQAIMINEIYDESGELIYNSEIPQFEKVLSKSTAGEINEILLNAVQEGTGKAMHNVYGIQSDIAGKTGTSQNYSDAWFFGYTENLVCGVWVGAMSPEVHFRSGANGSGSRLALPIAGGMLHDIENDPGLRSKYLTGFNEMINDTLSFNCEPYRELSILEDLFQKKESSEKKETRKNKKESRKDKKEKKDSKFKSFFKRLFGKKDKEDK